MREFIFMFTASESILSIVAVMAALSFQPFALRLFNAPLGVDFLRNLSAKISPFFECERD